MSSPFADNLGEINPYAPSHLPQPVIPATAAANQPLGGLNGLWRKGNLIVVHPQGEMPQICIKTGNKGDKWVKQQLTWYPKWALIGLLGGVFPLLVLVLIFQKKRDLSPWLCQEEYDRRSRFRIVGFSTIFGGIALVIGAIAVGVNMPGDVGVALAVLTLITGVVGTIVGLVIAGPLTNLLRAKKITTEYALIKGAKEPFLQNLEEFPYPLP